MAAGNTFKMTVQRQSQTDVEPLSLNFMSIHVATPPVFFIMNYILGCILRPTLPLTVQQCPDPGEVVNGARSVRPEAGFAVGTVVRFSCNQGYQLEGPSQISCHGRDTGTPKWSDRSPKCVCKAPFLYSAVFYNSSRLFFHIPYKLRLCPFVLNSKI